ncbi:MAG: NnrS family protein [gamma proteobacterium endosymbiont of Lamellibrachia anaximandri]|nr:NnrS family protein [gamma proteobacterium endosymbiont of Lamellibrachia anaximandri]
MKVSRSLPMCITVLSKNSANARPKSRIWQWLTQTPLRLLGSASVVFLLLAAGDYLLGEAVSVWQGDNLLFGIAPLPFFGYLLQRYPEWLKRSPVPYVRYGALFFLFAAAQVVFHLSRQTGGAPGLFYLALLAVGWYLAITTLVGIYRFALDSHRTSEGWINGLLYVGAAALLLSGLGLILGEFALSNAGFWLGFGGWLLPSLLLAALRPLLRPGQALHIP